MKINFGEINHYQIRNKVNFKRMNRNEFKKLKLTHNIEKVFFGFTILSSHKFVNDDNQL